MNDDDKFWLMLWPIVFGSIALAIGFIAYVIERDTIEAMSRGYHQEVIHTQRIIEDVETVWVRDTGSNP